MKLDHMYLIKYFLIFFRGSERLIGGKLKSSIIGVND